MKFRFDVVTPEFIKQNHVAQPSVVIRNAIISGMRMKNDLMAIMLSSSDIILCFFHIEIIGKDIAFHQPIYTLPGRSQAYYMLFVRTLQYCVLTYNCTRYFWTAFRGKSNLDILSKTFGVHWATMPQSQGSSFVIINNQIQFTKSDEFFYERVDGDTFIMVLSEHNGKIADEANWYYEENDAWVEAQPALKLNEPLDEEAPEYTKEIRKILEDNDQRVKLGLKPLRIADQIGNVFGSTISIDNIGMFNEGYLEPDEHQPIYAAFTKINEFVDVFIICWIENNNTLVIDTVARTAVGLAVRILSDDPENQPIPNTDNLFKALLRFCKSQLGCTIINIHHVTWGSTKMLIRNLTEEAVKKGLIKNPTSDGDSGFYNIDNFKVNMRLCALNTCINIAFYQWDAHPHMVFCGHDCAQKVWRSKN